MRSAFNQKRNRIASTKTNLDEVYDFLGLNLVAPDQNMPKGKSPYAINCRRFAKNEDDTRVAIHTRRGSTNFSTPLGQALDEENTASVTDDLEFTSETWVDILWTAGASGVLTKLELYLKKVVSGNGPVIIETYTDSSGSLGALVGQTSIKASDISTTYAYEIAYLMDCPTIVNGDDYHMVVKVQDAGTGTYALGQTAGTGIRTSSDDGATWTPLTASARFKTYLSTAGDIIGYTRRNPQNLNYRTLFAFGTNVYEVPDNTGTPASIDTNIHADATYVRFDQVDDKTFWVDGHNPARWWTGTGSSSVIAGVAGNPTHVLIYENRACFVPDDDPTRVNFSALFDFETYASDGFFYVPNPKSPDHITALTKFQKSMTIFTRKSKHIVYGSSISTFTRDEAVGTQGAISQEAVAVGKNKIYFMSDDRMMYAWNGNTDDPISTEMEREFQNILDLDKVRVHLYRNELRVYYNTKDDPTVNKMAIYDIIQEQWFTDTGRSVMGSLEWDQNDNELIEFSSLAGWIFRGNSGYSDLGKGIAFKYWTQYQMYGSGMAKDRVKKFRPVVRPAATPYYLQVGKDVDFENNATMAPWLVDAGGAKWGNFVWGDGTKWGSGKRLIDNTAPMSGRGKYTQYRFECDTVDTPVWLLGYQALVKSGRPR
jgi:hypothetical protein